MNKPYIKKSHFIIELLGTVLILAAISVAIYGMVTITGEIPTHYDAAGNVDGYGSPAILLLLPITMLFTNALIGLILHFMPTSMWNMPTKIKEGREIVVFSDVSWMMTLLEFIVGAFTLVATIFFTHSQIVFVAAMFLVVLTFVVIGIGIARMIKHNK